MSRCDGLGHDEVAERLRLERRGGVEAPLGEALEHVEQLRPRGAAVPSIAPRALPGPVEEEAPAEGILLERQRPEVDAVVADPRHVPDERSRVARRRVHENRARAHVVDESERLRRGHAEALAAERDIDRHTQPRSVRHAERPVRGRHEPDVHLGKPEHGARVVARDDRVARQRELEAATERRSVDRRDDRLAQPLEPAKRVTQLRRDALRVRRELDRRQEVGAHPHDEAVRFSARHDHRSDGCVLLDPRDGRRQPRVQGEGDRVLGLARVVDGDDRDAVAPHPEGQDPRVLFVGSIDDSDGRRAHDAASSTTAAPRPPAAHPVARPSPPPRRRSA